MREKKEAFIVTFRTTTGAMAMEQRCRASGLPGRLIPVPRAITAGCGRCGAAPLRVLRTSTIGIRFRVRSARR